MKRSITLYLAFISLTAFGQNKIRRFPFKLNLIDHSDTLLNYADFNLTSGSRIFIPKMNDTLNYFQFENVDTLVDFNISYKNKQYKLKDVESYRLMSHEEWDIIIDTLASDTCYEMIAKSAGCFINAYVGPYPIPACKSKHHIWLTELPWTSEEIRNLETRELDNTKDNRK